ncbi:MAG TPA: TIGR03016 family PEP-CTERM system-associated outer membrane protein [Rhodocyclaceae bacterium]|nr:TIGR03016 family PEP-CTERM system-associated outer membrane protein [Rhodocyclaceae bacterium]
MKSGRWRACLLAGLSLAAGRAVFAQQMPDASASTSAASASVAGGGAASAGIDAAAPPSGAALRQRGWDFKPSIGIDLTQTDNVFLQAKDPSSDLIVKTSPGLLLQGQSARASAYVDLQLQQINYMNNGDRDRLQHAFNGTGKIEVLENWLYLDLSGRISRQATSVFAPPTSGSDSINNNVVEARSYRVSPYIKGRAFGAADYMLRFDNTQYSSKNGPMRDTTVQSVQGNLAGASPLMRLGWSLDGATQQVDYSSGAQNKTDSLRGNLTYTFDPQFRFTVIHGQESNDYVNFQQQTSNINGWGFEWAPNERTQLAWKQEHRYFGQGHDLRLTYRTPHTAWRISDSRDVAVLAPQTMTYSVGTYFELLDEQFKSAYPDDAERAAIVLAYLQSLNLSPDAQVIGGFMSSRASINRRREISFTWTGVRNVITMSAQESNRTALGTGADIPIDDFSLSSTIRQRGINFNWAHKLTPNATLTFVGGRAQVTGNTSNLDTDRTTYSLNLSRKLGVYTSATIGVRKSKVSGYLDYDENAVIASLIAKF